MLQQRLLMMLFLTYVATSKCIRTQVGGPPCTRLSGVLLLCQLQQCSNNDSSLEPARLVHTKNSTVRVVGF